MKKILIRIHTDGFVYCLVDRHNNICRIGKTDKKAIGRIEKQVAYYPYNLEVIKIAVKNITECETYLHRFFRPQKLKSDWFNILPEQFLEKVAEYKKNNRGQLGYKVEESLEYLLKITHITNKRRSIHKK